MTVSTGWPTHGNAVNARNDTADLLTDMVRVARELKRRVRSGDVNSDETIFWLSEIEVGGLNALRILEREGAPTRPQVDLLL